MAKRRGSGEGSIYRRAVGRWVTDWLDIAAEPAVKPRTYEGYAARVQNHLIPSLGCIRLAKLTPDQVLEMMNTKSAEGLSPGTVQGIAHVMDAETSTSGATRNYCPTSVEKKVPGRDARREYRRRGRSKDG